MPWIARDPTSPQPNEISISSKTVRPSEPSRSLPTTWSPAIDSLPPAYSTNNHGKVAAQEVRNPHSHIDDTTNLKPHTEQRIYHGHNHSISWHAVRHDGCRRNQRGRGTAL